MGVNLVHHISQASMVTYHVLLFFETVLGREHSVSKNSLVTFISEVLQTLNRLLGDIPIAKEKKGRRQLKFKLIFTYHNKLVPLLLYVIGIQGLTY